MAKPTFLDFLQAVYLNETLPLNVRLRAAIEAGPYELPKKPSSMSINYDETFAGRLEAAIRLSNMKLIEGRVILNPNEDADE
jgi:hypothetical protein